MMVDFGYRWQDWREALWVLDRLEDCDLYFAEATLHHDDLEGHAKLAARAGTRIGGAEMAATVFECREWLERGRVGVLQPDIGRCGGLTETTADRGARGAGRRARHPALLEDGDHGGGVATLPGRHGERPVHRDALSRDLRLAPARGADATGA